MIQKAYFSETKRFPVLDENGNEVSFIYQPEYLVVETEDENYGL